MEHLSDDHEDRTNQYENSYQLCDEKGNTLLSLKESQRKLRHNQILMERKQPKNKY